MKNLLVIIPFHNPLDWHTDYTNQTANLLSKRYTVLCFLWGDTVSIREIVLAKKRYFPIQKNANIWLYTPLYLIPGKRNVILQHVNMLFNLIGVLVVALIIALKEKRSLLLWFFGFFDPVFILIPPFFRFIKTVYDCVDVPYHPNPSINRRIQHAETTLLSYAWIVTANSHTMLSRLLPIRADTHLVPLGFRSQMFQNPSHYAVPFSSNRPIIGYIGAIDYRMNIRLLERLVKRNRTWQFALMGPVFDDHISPTQHAQITRLLTEPNVFHALVPKHAIPSILNSCHITIIPYRKDSMFNRFAFPMKTMEYLYAQKPVVATAEMKELHRYKPYISFASTTAEWERRIRFALHHPLLPSQKRKARTIAMCHSWDAKIDALCGIIDAKQKDPSIRPHRIKTKPQRIVPQL